MNKAMESGWSESTAILAAVGTMLLGGPLLGALNGLVITKGRITPFIATLGTMVIFRSLSLVFVDGGEYRASAAGFAGLAQPDWMGDWSRRFTALLFFALAIVLGVVLKRTWFGTAVHAVGDNETAARYAGIKLDRVRIATYALCGLMCGIAAFIVSTRMNSIASAQTGQLYELDAIAAVVVGGASMRGGLGSILGTVVGVLILGVVNNMLNMISSSDTLKALGLEGVNIAHLQGLVKGLIIIAAVFVQRSR
jgi:ribose transport system permease protein